MFTVCERKRKSNDIKKLKNTENHKQFCCGGGRCGDEKDRRKRLRKDMNEARDFE